MRKNEISKCGRLVDDLFVRFLYPFRFPWANAMNSLKSYSRGITMMSRNDFRITLI